MTTVNASNSTEALDLTDFSNQYDFVTRDEGGNNLASGYSWISSGGDDVQVTGQNIDFTGNPPAFGRVSRIEIDLSNNGSTHDVAFTNITAASGGGALSPARLEVITDDATAFFNEIMSHNDIITGSAFGDTVKGGGGIDFIDLGDGNDVGVGGAGADIIQGGDDNDQLSGEAGDDELFGDGGLDQLSGGDGNDTLSGGSGIDELSGDAGDDTFRLNSPDIDNIVGGAGIDTIDARLLGRSLTLDLTAGTIKAGIFTTQEFGVENAIGSFANDTLIGDAAANRLDGAGGGDTLIGREGNDVYIVSESNDHVDEATLGGGIDTVESGVTFSLSGSRAAGDIENVTLTGTGNISATGNALANRLVGNAGSNTLNGNAGADLMLGRGGDDRYTVDEVGDVVDETLQGSGTDLIQAFVSLSLSGPKVLGSVENLTLLQDADARNGAGNGLANTMIGNTFNNDLMGLGGNDRLIGNGGADTFVFNAALNAATNVDVITDFSVADDTMRLENAFMPGLVTGTLAASAFRVGTTAVDASDRIIYNDDTGAVFFDQDGSGAAAKVQFATLDAGLAMSNSEFFVV